jgi:hypothetical protein
MPRYMIEVPHSSDKRACLHAVHVFLATGSHYIREDALRIVPPAFRQGAKVTQLNGFSLDQVESLMEIHTG